jgi:biotin carboxylase
MPSKTLLVLAASRYQLDTIDTARRLGYRVVTTDNLPSNPGHARAHRSYDADTTDVPAVLRIARDERIDGVISPCTDVAVVTAARVAAELGLPGIPPESAAIATDKARFRAWLAEQGLPCPDTLEIGPGHDVPAAWFDAGPALLKPTRASGSKGVVIVRDHAEYLAHRDDTLAHSGNRRAVLERFLPGAQGTCEGILASGRVAFACVTDRLTVPPPHTATAGHMVPPRMPADARDRLITALEDAWARLGIADGPFDCDFVAHPDGPIHLIEISPRLGGNSLSALIRAAYDFDLVAYAVRFACGDAPEPPPRHVPTPTAQLILGTAAAGPLDYDHAQLEALRREPWVRTLELDVPAGTPVEPFVNGRHRVGEATLQAADRDTLEARVDELRRRLRLAARPADAP